APDPAPRTGGPGTHRGPTRRPLPGRRRGPARRGRGVGRRRRHPVPVGRHPPPQRRCRPLLRPPRLHRRRHLPRQAHHQPLKGMPMTGRTTNWAGNVTFTPSLIHRPATVDQLRDLVANARHVRALGTGHSFNRLADTPGVLASVADLPPVMDIHTDRATVTVTAGTRYGELSEHLHAAGYAL